MVAEDRPYQNTVAVLATMRGKQQVIAPALQEGLGLRGGLALGWIQIWLTAQARLLNSRIPSW